MPWKGKWTKELESLTYQYMAQNDGYPPDGYDELAYEHMTYERYLGYLKKAVETHQNMCDVVP